MDRRELDKRMREDVKPGTESLAINEAQTAANQLLTEQRMNNESSRAVMTSNAERDVELRGAIELGSMNQPQAQQVVQQLPAQAAALRPETQQLLARYGVNPQISESSKSSSNSTQTRSSNTVRKDAPNPQGGKTTVTNTTNITNITNNNTRTETDIDMAASQPTPAPVQRVVAQPVAVAQGGDGKFKAFLNNLFAKRDLERRTQEKEFRKRDWDLQRMTRKVMERMEKISTSFAKKMNPENVGKTYGSQIKMMLTMAGLTLLPKLFPKMISGLNVVGDYVMKGVDFLKTTFNSAEGNVFDKLGTTVMESTKALGTEINKSIGRWIAGPNSDAVDSDGNGWIGIGEAISNKLAHWLGGNADPNGKNTLGAIISNLFEDFKHWMQNSMDLQMEDRSKAIKSVTDKISWNPVTWFKSLPDLLGAAIGGSTYLASSALKSQKTEANAKLREGETDGEFGYFGGIKSDKGSRRTVNNLAKIANDKTLTNSVSYSEAFKNVYEYGAKEGNGMVISEDEVLSILERTTGGDQKLKSKLLGELKYAVDKNAIKRLNGADAELNFSEDGLPTDMDLTNKTGKYFYKVPPESVPTMIAILSGFSDATFNEKDTELINSTIKAIFSKSESYNKYVEALDARILGNTEDRYDIMGGLVTFLTNNLGSAVNNVTSAVGMGDVVDTSDPVRFKYSAEENSDLYEYNKHKKVATERQTEQDALNKHYLNSGLTGQTGVTTAHVTNQIEQTPDKVKATITEAGNKVMEVAKAALVAAKDTYDYTMRGADLQGHGQHDSNYTRGWYAEGSRVSVAGGTQAPEATGTQTPQPKAKTELDKEEWIANRINQLKVSPIADQSPENLRKIAEQQYQDEVASKRPRTPLNQRIQYAMEFLQRSGFTAEQAAGMVGVLIAESNLDPSAVNKMEVNKYGFHKAGKGIAQWSNSRNNDFIDWYKANYGVDSVYPNEAPMEAQLKFMIHEMSGRTAFLEAMKEASTPDQAADVMLRGYENGGPRALATPAQIDETYAKYNNGYEKQLTTRVGHAREVYKLHTGNELTGPIDQALLQGSKYEGKAEFKSDNAVANTFADVIKFFNDKFGNDSDYVDSGAKIDKVDGGALAKYTAAAQTEDMPATYNAGTTPEVTVTAPKIVTSDTTAQAAKAAQQAVEKPTVTPEAQTETTQTDQPNMINTGGNIMNSGNVTNENVTINHYGRSTGEDVACSFTGTRSRDYANR